MKNVFDFPFLQKLDRYFLLNYRLLWMTKIHYVLFYGAVFYAAVFGVVQLYPMDLHTELPQSGWFAFFASLVALVPAVFWVYKQVIYSIERNFGLRFKGLEVLRAGIYLLVFGLIIGVPFFTGALVDTKINRMTTIKEFRSDIQKINLGKQCIFIKKEDRNAMNNRNYFSPSAYCSDCVLNEKGKFKMKTDSYFGIDLHSPVIVIENFIATSKKYGTTMPFTAQEAYEAYKNGEALDINRFDFEGQNERYTYDDTIRVLNWKLQDLAELKVLDTWWNKNFNLFLATILTFLFANVLLIYKNTSLRTLIFSAISSLGLFLLFVAFIAVVETFYVGRISSQIGLGALFVGYLFFLAHALSIFNRKAFSRFKEISLVLVAVATPFLGLYFLAVARVFGDVYIREFWTIFTVMLVSFGAYLVFVLPLFQQLFIKLKSLPKE